jgi:hypothetical protein
LKCFPVHIVERKVLIEVELTTNGGVHDDE